MITFIIFMCVLYTLLPIDLIPDDMGWPGRVDEGLFFIVSLWMISHLKKKSRLLESFEKTEAMKAGRVLWNPHVVLGVSEKASAGEIKEAFHKQINIFQPEKMKPFGPEFMERAQNKMEDIKKAYEELSEKP